MKTVKCTACGKEVELPAEFCDHCGAPVTVARNLVPCRVCGGTVAKNATKCPHCGAKNPNKSLLIAKAIILCVFFIFLVSCIASFGNSDAEDATQTPSESSPITSETKTSAEETPEYIEVDAIALWEAYQDNEVNADLLYGDKLLAVTGTVTNIGKDIVTEAPCVSLDSGSAYALYPIQCFFPKNGEQTEQLAALSDGDVVTIYGTCTGEFVTTVQLSKCYLATDA